MLSIQRLSRIAVALSLWIPAAAGQGAQFVPIPGAFTARDITPDGQLVVGSGSGGGYYWNWQVDLAPTFIGGNEAVAVSDDGAIIAGNIDDPSTGAEVAALWTQASGWQILGGLPNAPCSGTISSAYDMSGDGSTVVGLSWDSCDGRAFRWTQANGVEELEVLGNGGNRASAIAGDASLMGGFAQGSTRTPAVWFPNTTGALFNIGAQGEVYDISEDGSFIAGQYNGQAFISTGAPNVTLLGSLNGSPFNASAGAVSADGQTVFGWDSFLLDRIAWVWTATAGIESLRDRLTNEGVPGVPVLGTVSRASSDGQTVVGQTNFGGGAWIAVLPNACGSSANTCVAAPNSVGTGAAMNSNGSFSVSANALELTAGPVPNQFGVFYYGSVLLNGGSGIPFGDGFRCVGGSQVFRLPVELASGNLLSHAVDLSSPPSPGGTITGGSTWFFQAWYRDPAAMSSGFNLSDALEVNFCP
ncbi:MAG TPA: hypothetical protein QF764_10545 [Planctomycetota bacterium]|jgi:uncharacterized membrane protein|nr:hypothetical protein [Planctomycetota bacterium]